MHSSWPTCQSHPRPRTPRRHTPTCRGQWAALQWDKQRLCPAPSSKLLSVTSESRPGLCQHGCHVWVCVPYAPTALNGSDPALPRQHREQTLSPRLRWRPHCTGPGAEARRARHSAPAGDKHTGALEGWPPGIQFFVFPKEVIVHLIICGFEIVNIRLVGCWSWKLHVGSCSEGPDAEPPFAERHKGQERSQSD